MVTNCDIILINVLTKSLNHNIFSDKQINRFEELYNYLSYGK